VIRGRKIANYHPYPPTPWNASPRDSFGTPGPYEDAIQGTPIFEENGPDDFKGIDIMRAVRSFDPCLPCGVHMFLGKGRTIEQIHPPMQLPTGARCRSRCCESSARTARRPVHPARRRVPTNAARCAGCRWMTTIGTSSIWSDDR